MRSACLLMVAICSVSVGQVIVPLLLQCHGVEGCLDLLQRLDHCVYGLWKEQDRWYRLVGWCCLGGLLVILQGDLLPRRRVTRLGDCAGHLEPVALDLRRTHRASPAG